MTGNEAEKIGALTAKVEALEKRTEGLEDMLREVRDTIISTKGSWKVLVAVGGLLVAVSSFLTSLVLKFWPGHG